MNNKRTRKRTQKGMDYFIAQEAQAVSKKTRMLLPATEIDSPFDSCQAVDVSSGAAGDVADVMETIALCETKMSERKRKLDECESVLAGRELKVTELEVSLGEYKLRLCSETAALGPIAAFRMFLSSL